MIKSPSSLTNCSLCMEKNLRQELCGVFFEMYPVSVPALPCPQGDIIDGIFQTGNLASLVICLMSSRKEQIFSIILQSYHRQ